VIAAAVFCGLLAGEAAQFVETRAGSIREKWLGGFRLPTDVNVASRNLALYSIGSAAYTAFVSALLSAVALMFSLRLAELVIDRAGLSAGGLAAWAAALPAIAVATVAHAFSTRALGRMAALGFLLAVVVSWLL
jgi:hypothetical protein